MSVCVNDSRSSRLGSDKQMLQSARSELSVRSHLARNMIVVKSIGGVMHHGACRASIQASIVPLPA